jgi:hypothetical protein
MFHNTHHSIEESSTMQHLQERRGRVMYETTPSRKEATSTRCCPDERTGPRAPPGTPNKMEQGSHDDLRKGMVSPESSISSVSHEQTRVSPENPHPQPSDDPLQRILAGSKPHHHRTCHPTTRATMVKLTPSPSPSCNRHEACKTMSKGKA